MWNLNEYFGPGVDARVTGVEQDFSLPENDDEVFSGTQKEFLDTMEIDTERVCNIRQVHGATVLVTDEPTKIIPKADGLVTDQREVVLAVRTADCLPIFLFDPVKQCCGLIHAGWKSTQQKICSQALKIMYQNYESYPADLRVVFGPSIHRCCYQVDQEFCEIFPEQMIPRDGNWFLDLQAVNRQELFNFGVREENLSDIGQCTCCNQQCFSYRRDGEKSGRHLSLMKLV